MLLYIGIVSLILSLMFFFFGKDTLRNVIIVNITTITTVVCFGWHIYLQAKKPIRTEIRIILPKEEGCPYIEVK